MSNALDARTRRRNLLTAQTDSQRPIKVIIVPRHEGENPYDKALAASLRELGVEVCLPKSKPPFLFWNAVRACGKPDIIHLQRHHGLFVKRSWGLSILSTALFFLQWLTLRLLGVRFVWTVHNLINHENVRADWELFWDRILARIADGILVHCKAVIPIVAKTYGIPPERLGVAQHANYTGWMPPAVSREQARQELGLPQDQTILLFFGAVRKYKGISHLIDVVDKMNLGRTRLLVVGKPFPADVGAQLEAQAKHSPQIQLHLEEATNAELVQYICASDLVILPYVDSLTSGAILLAATYARPVVAPKLGCMCEFPSGAAELYEPTEPDGLERAMRVALGSSLSETGAAAKAYADTLSWSKMAQQTLRGYERALGRANSNPQAPMRQLD